MQESRNNELAQGIAPESIGHVVPLPLKKDFKGWHKPRKQWVRREQWCKETRSLLEKLRLDGRPLRYLSLPGEDMLDIRVLAALCTELNQNLKCLGFDESIGKRSDRAEVNISRNEISNCIEPTSVIRADNISVLKSTTSQGFKYVKELGPFDVINLDLCGSLSCVDCPDNHQALKNLCEFQVNESREPWLLFLTTRAESQQVNLEHLPRYLEILKKNTDNLPCFGDRFTQLTGFDMRSYRETDDNQKLIDVIDGAGFVRLFAAGIGKWLLQLVLKSKISWEVNMLDSCWYRVEDNQTSDSFPNMLSLAFLFSPTGIALIDSSGLASSNPAQETDEGSLAMGILEKTENLTDLDVKVDLDGVLHDELVRESADLMKAARYERDPYVEWANRKRIRFEAC